MTMTKRNNRATKSTATKLDKFDVLAWVVEVRAVALEHTTAVHNGNVCSGRMLALVLTARGVAEGDTVRENIKLAYAEAYAQATGITAEEAGKNKSVQNRVSDAMCVFNAVDLPACMPAFLQKAAAECRKLNPSNRRPLAGGKGAAESQATVNPQDVNPLALLAVALGALKAQANSAKALELIGELVDLAADLAEALAEALAEDAKAA